MNISKTFTRISLLLLNLSCLQTQAQTPAADRLHSIQQNQESISPFAKMNFRNIGPSIMSGRVTDIEVNPQNPHEFYVAYASGGVWYSNNNGLSFTPIFDKVASMTIGDMAMDWKNNQLWVGTGEVNSSRSSYAGTGVYLSADSGKTWQHKGLPESHHIGRIILHPENRSMAWVAVLGHLYTPNTERGIFKTIDGGKTWKQTLFINDTTGCVDLQIDPQHPDILYASAWTRTRSAWNFSGNGEGSAIYKSIDGGEHWNNITNEDSGFPTGKGVGRIGISICRDHPETVYAILDNQFNQKEDSHAEKKMNARDLSILSTDDFLALDNDKLSEYLHSNGYPEKYTAESTKEAVRKKTYTVKDIADWKLADADANLFNTPVIGAEVYRSNDGGTHWQKTHSDLLNGVYFTYGYYFGTISVSPTNPEKIYIAGYPVLKSVDGGKTFTDIDGDNCHPDYHRVWIHPQNDDYIITGNDGGLNISYDGGKHWYKANNPPVGQFYAVQVDNDKPYNVYGGLQDNGTWTASSETVENSAWHQSGQYPYKNIGDGDGMQVQVDTRDNATAYVGYQFGNYYRINKNTGENADVKPVHEIGQTPYRFNWQTPILLSKHHQDIFYLGSNQLHRSLHQGRDIETVSPDLTANDKKGNIPYGTLTTLSESPLKFGLLYTGSDDGKIYVSRDGTYSWQDISNGLPQHLWVTRVVASRYAEGRVYVSLNAYRNDNFNAYIFMSDDYGAHWKALGKNLPAEPVNVVREDPKNEKILYAGTDNGLYVSFDQGEQFMRCAANLPRVAIHDIAIQDRENEMILGTHGRSIYIAKLDWIQDFPTYKDSNLFLFTIDTITYNAKLGSKSSAYSEPRREDILLPYFTKEAGVHTFSIKTKKGQIVQTFTDTAVYGFNTAHYHAEVTEQWALATKPNIQQADDKKYYLVAGTYKVEIENPQGEKRTRLLLVKESKKKEESFPAAEEKE